ncbi:MAG: sugar ABC transporter permease [Firmicutes bacterium]|nr:sugar ABC transporter permease [Bacillota bacterium]
MLTDGDKWLPYKFIAPSIICLLLINVFPLFYGIGLSFFRFQRFGTVRKFAGLANYVRALAAGSQFWEALGHSAIFSILTTAGSYFIGLVLALLLNGEIKGRNLYRALILLPWVMPSAVIALVWRWLYNDTYGIINIILTQLGIISEPIQWLGNPDLALYSVTLVNIWKAYPFMMVVLLAGLQAIPGDLYEAASIDGASRWQTFKSITFPLLGNVTLISTLLMFIWTFNYYDLIALMTGGGPAFSSHVLATHAYETGFMRMDYGLAAAISTIMLIMLFVFSIVYFRVYRKGASEA